MPDVQFEETVIPSSDKYVRPEEYSGIIGFVVKSGLAKSKAQANVVLIVITILTLALAVFIIISGTREGNPDNTPPGQEPEVLTDITG